MVITALTRNQVGGNVSWVRIPPTPRIGKTLEFILSRVFYFVAILQSFIVVNIYDICYNNIGFLCGQKGWALIRWVRFKPDKLLYDKICWRIEYRYEVFCYRGRKKNIGKYFIY